MMSQSRRPAAAIVHIAKDGEPNLGPPAKEQKTSAQAKGVGRGHRVAETGVNLSMLRSSNAILRPPASGITCWAHFCDPRNVRTSNLRKRPSWHRPASLRSGRPSRHAQLTLRWHTAYSKSTLNGRPERGQQPYLVSQKQESSCGGTAYLDHSAERLQRRVRPSRCHQVEIHPAGSIRKPPAVPQGGPGGT